MLLTSMSKNPLPNPMMKLIPLCFPPRSLSFSSYIEVADRFGVNFCIWCKSPTLFLCLWISGCPHTIGWRDCFFPLNDLGTLFQDQLGIDVWVYFRALDSLPLIRISSSMAVPHCFDYCSSVLSFEIRTHESFSFVLF